MKVKLRISSALIVLVLIVRLLCPRLFVLPKIDGVSVALLILALITFYFADIYRFLKKIHSKTIIRALISLLCIGLIILRFVKPELKFDGITLNLLVITVIVLIIPDIKDLLLRIRKVKKGDFEAEFGEAITNLVNGTTQAEHAVEAETSTSNIYAGVSNEVAQRLAELATDPRGAFLILAIEIESRIRELGNQLNIAEANRPVPLIRILENMARQGYINGEVIAVFRDFWVIRNRVAHGAHYDLDSGRLYELVDLGLRILRLLPSDIQNARQE